MSTLAAAAKALQRKSMPVKQYRVQFEETELHEVVVEAVDQQEAEIKAQEEFNNGNAQSVHGSQSEIVNCDEI